MGAKKLNILFITEASLTGAPVLLAEVLKLVSQRQDIAISILITRDDKLATVFRQYGKVYILKGSLYQINDPSLPVKAIRAARTFFKKIVVYPKLAGTRIIISNTATNGNILRELVFLRAKVVCYVHELEKLLRNWKPQSAIKNTFRYTHFYMVPSRTVKDNLITNHAVPEQRIKIFDTYLPLEANPDAIKKQLARKAFCEPHNINPAHLLVVGMGSAEERKGIDLFIEVARLSKGRNISFTWIGGFANKEVETMVNEKIRSYDLANILFTGPLPRSYTNLLPFDLFFLSSREDPYPLVVLEAAAVAIPAVCFAGSGGIVDFVKDSGWIIDDFSVERMAEKIAYLDVHRQELAGAGGKAHNNFINLHNNRQRLMHQFDEILNAVTTLK